MYYALVFLSAMLVDLIPFIGPPAWSVMVFFQMKFHLNIWIVLAAGVIGSTIGRYLLTLYVPRLTSKIINRKKDADLQFLGKNSAVKNGRYVSLFSFIH